MAILLKSQLQKKTVGLRYFSTIQILQLTVATLVSMTQQLDDDVIGIILDFLPEAHIRYSKMFRWVKHVMTSDTLMFCGVHHMTAQHGEIVMYHGDKLKEAMVVFNRVIIYQNHVVDDFVYEWSLTMKSPTPTLYHNLTRVVASVCLNEYMDSHKTNVYEFVTPMKLHTSMRGMTVAHQITLVTEWMMGELSKELPRMTGIPEWGIEIDCGGALGIKDWDKLLIDPAVITTLRDMHLTKSSGPPGSRNNAWLEPRHMTNEQRIYSKGEYYKKFGKSTLMRWNGRCGRTIS